MSWSTCHNYDMHVIGDLIVCDCLAIFSIHAIFASKRIDLYWEVEKWPGAGLIGIGYVVLLKVMSFQTFQGLGFRFNSSSDWTDDGGWIEIQYSADEPMNDDWVMYERHTYYGRYPERRGWILGASGRSRNWIMVSENEKQWEIPTFISWKGKQIPWQLINILQGNISLYF